MVAKYTFPLGMSLIEGGTFSNPFTVQLLPQFTHTLHHHRIIRSTFVDSMQRYCRVYQDDCVAHISPNSHCIESLAAIHRPLRARALDAHFATTSILSRIPHLYIGMDDACQLGIRRNIVRRLHSPSVYTYLIRLVH